MSKMYIFFAFCISSLILLLSAGSSLARVHKSFPGRFGGISVNKTQGGKQGVDLDGYYKEREDRANISSRGVLGTCADSGVLTYMVALLIYTTDGEYLCSGSFVSCSPKTVVLTAQHCVYPLFNVLYVEIYPNIVNVNDILKDDTSHPSITVTPNTGNIFLSADTDIAMIVFDGVACGPKSQFPNIKPLAIPDQCKTVPSNVLNTKTCGYGRDIPTSLFISFPDCPICGTTISTPDQLQCPVVYGTPTPAFYCSNGVVYSPCGGDSGSSAVISIKGVLTSVGVVSAGFGYTIANLLTADCFPPFPVVYANVCITSAWIKTIIGG